ncbi:hypothetical protein V6N13_093316 [Hibiscus sabdariffa]
MLIMETESSYWRKVRPSGYRNQGYNFEQGEPSGNKGGEISNKQVEGNNPENVEMGRENAWTELKSQNKDLGMSSLLNEGKRKKIVGHVENENLWKYRRCLVGKMALVCSLSNVMSRLDTWGFGEITVKRMGRLAELWGSFEDVGENFNMKKDCEKVTILISTGHVKEIEELVEIEVGDIRYLVRVKEIGLLDNSASVLKVSPKEKGGETQKPLNDVSSSDSSSVSSRRRSPEKGLENINSLGDDSLNAVSLGKEENKGGCTTGMEPNRHIEENEMKGCEHVLPVKNINDKIPSTERTVIK